VLGARSKLSAVLPVTQTIILIMKKIVQHFAKNVKRNNPHSRIIPHNQEITQLAENKKMNGVLKYLFAVWAGILVYVILSFSFGPTGLMAYRHLRNEQARQEENLERLWRLNLELENTVNALRHDRDTLAVFARELGYAAPGEYFIRIVGLGGGRQTLAPTGEIAFASTPQVISNMVALIIALFIGAAIFICMIVFDVIKNLKERLESFPND